MRVDVGVCTRCAAAQVSNFKAAVKDDDGQMLASVASNLATQVC